MYNEKWETGTESTTDICENFISILDFTLSPCSECMNMEMTEYSEMLSYKIKSPGNYPEESIQHLFT